MGVVESAVERQRKESPMKFPVFLTLSLMLVLCVTSGLVADLVFKDDFERLEFTAVSWAAGAAGVPDFEISPDYNHTPGGKTCLKLAPKNMQEWKDAWHVVDKLIPARIRIWFYERGWKNNIKVDQQYLLVGDGTTDQDSANFCQIGQTGNPAYDGHYAIFDNAAWHVSIASSNEERWVKMEFVLHADGTAKIYIDDGEEFEFPQKWPHIGTIGVAHYGRNDRGGVTEGYWDDVEVFDTSEAPAAVSPGGKLSITWGKIKLN